MEFDIPVSTSISPNHVGDSGAQVLSFRTSITRAASNIDREARTIDNVILAQVGEARGHGVEIELSFLQDMDRYVATKMGSRVQCNFGHRWNSLGFQLGAFSQFRLEGNQYKGKLKVYKAADKSPELAQMAEWFMDIAEEDHKSVMCSIKFEPLHYYQYDKNNQKVIIPYSWWAGPQKEFQDKPAYVAFKRLISCDIVDEGALTDTLFSADDQGAAAMFHALTSAPDFKQFLADNYEHFPQLNQFYQERFSFSFGKLFNSLFNTQKMDPSKTPAQAATQDEQLTAMQAQLDEMQQQLAAKDAQIKELSPAPAPAGDPKPDAVTTLQAQIDEMQQQLAERDAKIKALSAEPAAAPSTVKITGKSTVDLKASDDKPWLDSPINQQARKYSRKAEAEATT